MRFCFDFAADPWGALAEARPDLVERGLSLHTRRRGIVRDRASRVA